MPERVDIAVLGGGPVGCALALALGSGGHSVVVLERAPASRGLSAALPFRPIALSYASRIILERLGAWAGLSATPIQTIHASQAESFGRTLLTAADAGVPALGYVVDYRALAQALGARLDGAAGTRMLRGATVRGVQVLDGEVEIDIERDGAPAKLRTRCVVHAEGKADDAHEKRYGYDAVVGLAAVEPAARNIAYERFTTEGPLALLPMTGAYAIVWSARPERAAALARCAPGEFLAELSRVTGGRPGRFTSVGERFVQPLALRVREPRFAVREIFIGNAAQTLHPVAGQGLNLGLRDAWDLADVLRDAPDPGVAALLHRFAAVRRLDAFATIRVTDLLARAFTGTNRLAAMARGATMAAIDVLPPARTFFARRMMFGPGDPCFPPGIAQQFLEQAPPSA
jgi:2-octaprenyl-6-methoxyphenol hydroxylase